MWQLVWLLGCGAVDVEVEPSEAVDAVAPEATAEAVPPSPAAKTGGRPVPPPPPADAAVPTLTLDEAHGFRGQDGTAYVIEASSEVHFDTAWTPTGPNGERPNAAHILLGFGKFYRVPWPDSGPLVIGPDTVAPLEGSIDEWIGFRSGTIVMVAAVLETDPGKAKGAQPIWATTVNVRGLDGSVPAMKSPLSTTGPTEGNPDAGNSAR